jgi:hypothetical protein
MVFGEFLKAAPSIAQDAHSWSKSADEPYDIISQTANGLTVKWQITEWLDPEQIQRSKERQSLKQAIDDAVRGLQMPDATTCWLFLQDPPTHFRPKHTARFYADLLALTRDVTVEWTKPLPRQRYTWPKQDECVALPSDIAAWPVLVHYLRKVTFRRSADAPCVSRPAVSVVGFADSFREEDAITQLMSRIKKKMEAYQWPIGEDVRLLIFYDEAWIHNSPPYAPLVVNAQIAARNLCGVAVPFKRTYLIFGRSGEAYEIHPDFKRCT